MARSLDRTQGQHLSAYNNYGGFPYAVGLWFYPLELRYMYLIWEGDYVNQDHEIALVTDSQGNVYAESYDYGTGDNGYAFAPTKYVINQWNFALGIFADEDDRRCYCNGGPGYKETDFATIPRSGDFEQLSVGAKKYGEDAGSYSNPFNGYVAEVGLYTLRWLPGGNNSAKADYFETNVYPYLAEGYSPVLTIAIDQRVLAYYPLGGMYAGDSRNRNIIDRWGQGLTFENGVGVADHPPNIIVPSPAFYNFIKTPPPLTIVEPNVLSASTNLQGVPPEADRTLNINWT